MMIRNLKLGTICFMVTALLAAAETLVWTHGTVYAAKQFKYELVRVGEMEAPSVVTKRVADGWEPVSISFMGSNTPAVEGFILFKK